MHNVLVGAPRRLHSLKQPHARRACSDGCIAGRARSPRTLCTFSPAPRDAAAWQPATACSVCARLDGRGQRVAQVQRARHVGRRDNHDKLGRVGVVAGLEVPRLLPPGVPAHGAQQLGVSFGLLERLALVIVTLNKPARCFSHGYHSNAHQLILSLTSLQLLSAVARPFKTHP